MRRYFEIIRPLNCLLFFFAGLFSCYIAIKGIEVFFDYRVLFLSTSLFFLCAGGHVINDYFDINVDKINKPKGTLPSSRIKIKNALIFSIVLFLISITFSLFINLKTFFIILIMCLLLIFYGKYSKRMKILGNVIVSLIATLILISAIFTVEKLFPIMWIIVPVFFINMSREIAKDIADVGGDKLIGKSSLPLKFGIKASSIVSFLFMILALISALIPYFYHVFNDYYFVVLLISLIFLIFMSISFMRQPRKNAKIYNKSLKIVMLLGLIAIFIG